eukprot:TRINITY_DN38041_c0_g1_i1.p1 TRINITY_DN38041_c0_g1~~TRINITY_DN38041_c0_g1_i1.p1  ORF type:complete len:286 (-),score=40.75 TRINITY_DN38041_c0_g1_i1:187-1044(-)
MQFGSSDYEVYVQNTFLHVCERPERRRSSAPAEIAILGFDSAVQAEFDSCIVYSLDDHDCDLAEDESNSNSGEDDQSCALNSDNPEKQDLYVYDQRASSVSLEDCIATASTGFAVSRVDSSEDARHHRADKATQCVRNKVAHVDASGHPSYSSTWCYNNTSFSDAAVHRRATKDRPSGTKSKGFTKMFVGNLPCTVSQDRMEAELCKQGFFGTYTSVHLPLKADGSGRGFGFVSFCSMDEARRFASIFNGYTFDAQVCYVSPASRQSKAEIYAQPKSVVANAQAL